MSGHYRACSAKVTAAAAIGWRPRHGGPTQHPFRCAAGRLAKVRQHPNRHSVRILMSWETTLNVPPSVDTTAPVLAHHEIEIKAPVEAVWALHVDVNG